MDNSLEVEMPDLSQAKTVERVTQSRKKLVELLQQFSPPQCLLPAENNGWTVKDILFHITTWEKRMIRWINMLLNGEEPEIRDPNFTWDDINRLNQVTYDKHKDLPLEQALYGFFMLGDEVVESVSGIVANQFNKEYFDIIAANTFLHYDEHLPAIYKVLKGDVNE